MSNSHLYNAIASFQLVSLALLVIASFGVAASRPSGDTPQPTASRGSLVSANPAIKQTPDQGTRKKDPSPCANALDQHTVCEAANKQALAIMHATNLTAATVMLDVRTGALLVAAASNPETLNVTSTLLPLSTVKLLLAASWWDHGLPDTFRGANGTQVSITEMLVSGDDNAGRETATKLRTSIGVESVLADLNRFGFPSGHFAPSDAHYWANIDPKLGNTFVPATSFNLLDARTTKEQWEDTLSIGETRFKVTVLHISRFLQSIGNQGVMFAPTARIQPEAQELRTTKSTRVLQESTAWKLQAAMRDTVERGTANGVATVLSDTGWRIGGKTGTGPGTLGPEADGWFAGLVFDRLGHARFTVATYVKRGGKGGGKAARLSAELARFIVGASPNS